MPMCGRGYTFAMSSGSNTPNYRGRFAPSPSGPLHFGSLVAALGSYLQARAHGGLWLLRIDDIDPPREVRGAAAGILRSLERYGLQWDGAVLYQSQRSEAYGDTLQRLAALGQSYPCACSRKEIAAQSPALVYPGTCRGGLPAGREGRAIRVRSPARPVRFEDRLQGPQVCNLEGEIGDFVVKRADGLYAYHLATALDDAFQGVTEIVRGADLLPATFPQRYLRELLELPQPAVLHLPVVTDAEGRKLSKQTRARAIDDFPPGELLTRALDFLHHPPPQALRGAPPEEQLKWAVAHWSSDRLPPRRQIPFDPHRSATAAEELA